MTKIVQAELKSSRSGDYKIYCERMDGQTDGRNRGINSENTCFRDFLLVFLLPLCDSFSDYNGRCNIKEKRNRSPFQTFPEDALLFKIVRV